MNSSRLSADSLTGSSIKAASVCQRTEEPAGERRRPRLFQDPSRRIVPFIVLSALLLLPCFWQPRIEAGDLASHIYNASLSQLIEHGKAPGLWIARQPTNVLFDYALSWLFPRFGAAVAQRIAVSVAVLVFFWGASAAVSVLSGKRAGFVVSCLAILSYGVIFHLGSFNFYIALGLAFFALALLWRPTVWRMMASVPLLALAWLGHPLPPLWVLAAALYAEIARRLSPRHRLLQMAVALLFVFAMREFVVHRFSFLWSPKQLAYASGADQVILGFSWFYKLLFLVLLALWSGWFIRQARSRGVLELVGSIPFQLYAICAFSAFLFPRQLLLSSYTLGDTPQRFSLVAGVLVCALMNTTAPSRFFGTAFLAVAVLFFARLYVDAARLNTLEAKVETIVSQFPPNERVFGQLYYPPGGPVDVSMIVDRACIAKCFSYGNYEPSMLQFRVRANAGNSIVAWNQKDPVPAQYFRSGWNQALRTMYQCGKRSTEVCVGSLSLHR